MERFKEGMECWYGLSCKFLRKGYCRYYHQPWQVRKMKRLRKKIKKDGQQCQSFQEQSNSPRRNKKQPNQKHKKNRVIAHQNEIKAKPINRHQDSHIKNNTIQIDNKSQPNTSQTTIISQKQKSQPKNGDEKLSQYQLYDLNLKYNYERDRYNILVGDDWNLNQLLFDWNHQNCTSYLRSDLLQKWDIASHKVVENGGKIFYQTRDEYISKIKYLTEETILNIEATKKKQTEKREKYQNSQLRKTELNLSNNRDKTCFEPGQVQEKPQKTISFSRNEILPRDIPSHRKVEQKYLKSLSQCEKEEVQGCFNQKVHFKVVLPLKHDLSDQESSQQDFLDKQEQLSDWSRKAQKSSAASHKIKPQYSHQQWERCMREYEQVQMWKQGYDEVEPIQPYYGEEPNLLKLLKNSNKMMEMLMNGEIDDLYDPFGNGFCDGEYYDSDEYDRTSDDANLGAEYSSYDDASSNRYDDEDDEYYYDHANDDYIYDEYEEESEREQVINFQWFFERNNRIKLNSLTQQQLKDSDQCIICFENFVKLEKQQKSQEKSTSLPEIIESNEYLVQLFCKHLYHQECIQNWLKSNPAWPVCRKDFRIHQAYAKWNHNYINKLQEEDDCYDNDLQFGQ